MLERKSDGETFRFGLLKLSHDASVLLIENISLAYRLEMFSENIALPAQ